MQAEGEGGGRKGGREGEVRAARPGSLARGVDVYGVGYLWVCGVNECVCRAEGEGGGARKGDGTIERKTALSASCCPPVVVVYSLLSPLGRGQHGC
eukprot:scaffold315936_cov32-Tisochrysis_lutea.AAC.1